MPTNMKQNRKNNEKCYVFLKYGQHEVYSDLHTAASNDDVDRVKKILTEDNYAKNPSSVFELKDQFNRTPLHWAAKNNNLEIFKLLLPKTPAHVLSWCDYEQGYDAKTPVHWAAFNANKEMFQLMLPMIPESTWAMRDINDEGSFGKCTPAQYLVLNGTEEMAKILYESKGLSPFLKTNSDGFNALGYAANNSPKIFSYLVSLMSDKRPLFEKGPRRTPSPINILLFHSNKESIEAQKEVAKILAQEDPKYLEIKFHPYDRTMLNWAVYEGHDDLAIELVKLNPKALTIGDGDGNIPLHTFALRHIRIMKNHLNDNYANPELAKVLLENSPSEAFHLKNNDYTKLNEIIKKTSSVEKIKRARAKARENGMTPEEAFEKAFPKGSEIMSLFKDRKRQLLHDKFFGKFKDATRKDHVVVK